MSRPTWAQAEHALGQLTPQELRVLLLLGRLPLLWTDVIQRLEGRERPWGLYDNLSRLRGLGLTGALQLEVWRGFAPRLLYLSDLGLAAISLSQGVDPVHLATTNGLRRQDLISAQPGLPHLAACYELLGMLAASQEGKPDLVAWERPWRGRYLRRRSLGTGRVRLPAYAALAWGGGVGEYVLLPDLGSCPLAAYRGRLLGLLEYRRSHSGRVPTLVIAAPSQQRVATWNKLLDELARLSRQLPLPTWLVTWSEVTSGLEPVHLRQGYTCRPTPEHDRPVRMRTRHPAPVSRPVPRIVGELPLPALRLGSADREMLDVVGRHPFLPLTSLAAVVGSSLDRCRRRRALLVEAGLARVLGSEEVGEHAVRSLTELTVEGLQVLAAQQGLSLAEAVRHNGLAGGGPDTPLGTRRSLLRDLEHTLGADEVFVELSGAAEKYEVERQCSLLEWRSPAACAVRGVRPDGYGLVRYAGEDYSFFLEYDRGTMQARDLRDKFEAYWCWLESGGFRRHYDIFPTVLVLTRDPPSEEGITRVLRSVGLGRATELPVLLSTHGRRQADRYGLLDPTWREQGSAKRRYWPSGPRARVLQRCRRHRME